MAARADRIAAINARIAALRVGGDGGCAGVGGGGGDNTSPSSLHRANRVTLRTGPVLSTLPLADGSVPDVDEYKIGGYFDDNKTTISDTSLSTATTGSTTIAISTISTVSPKIKTNASPLTPSDVSEDLDVEFFDHKRRYRFPPYGITVKDTSTSTYINVQFIDCIFDPYEGTLFDDCVCDDVIFNKCHFWSSTIVKMVAKGARFTGCMFGATHFEGIALIEDAEILNQSFAFDRVIRGSAADDSHNARGSAIQEFEVVKKAKGSMPRHHGWAKKEDSRAVQGAAELVETPTYAGWEGKVVKPTASSDLMSFEEPIDFNEAEAQARNSAVVHSSSLVLPATPNWQRQFIRQGANAVKLVKHEEALADAKTFAPTNFVKLDFNADPETRKEEVSDDFNEIGKREYYGARKDKSKRYWADKKAEQQEHRRCNIPGAPQYIQGHSI